MSRYRKSNRHHKSIAAAVSAAVFIVAPVVPAMAAGSPPQTQTASFGLPTSGYIEAEFSPLIKGSGNTISIMSPSLLGNNIGGYDFTFNGGRLGVQSGLATIYDAVNNSTSTNGPNGSTSNYTSSNLSGYAFLLGSVPEGGWDAALSAPNTTGSGAPTFWADAQYTVSYPHTLAVTSQSSSLTAGSIVEITATLNTTDPYAQAASADLQAPWMSTPVQMVPGAAPGSYTYQLQVPAGYAGAANISVGMQYTTLQASVPAPGEEQVSSATLAIAGGTGLTIQAAPSSLTVSPSGQQFQAGVPVTFSGTLIHLGASVSGATVSLAFDGQNAQTTTGPSGNYSMTVTPQNAGYGLVATVQADGQTTTTTDGVTPQTSQPTVPGSTYQFTISPSGQDFQVGVPVTFSGTLIQKGSPVSGATVNLTFDGQNGSATTASDGGYTITMTPQTVGYGLVATAQADGQTATATESVAPAPTQATQQNVPQIVYQSQPFYIPTQPFVSTPAPTTTDPASTTTNNLSSASMAIFSKEIKSISDLANLASSNQTSRVSFFVSIAGLVGIQPVSQESVALPWSDTANLPLSEQESLQALYNDGLVKGFPNGTLGANLPLTHNQEGLVLLRSMRYMAGQINNSGG